MGFFLSGRFGRVDRVGPVTADPHASSSSLVGMPGWSAIQSSPVQSRPVQSIRASGVFLFCYTDCRVSVCCWTRWSRIADARGPPSRNRRNQRVVTWSLCASLRRSLHPPCHRPGPQSAQSAPLERWISNRTAKPKMVAPLEPLSTSDVVGRRRIGSKTGVGWEPAHHVVRTSESRLDSPSLTTHTHAFS